MNFLDPSCPWAGYPLADLVTCEARVCSWVRQPINTYSNIAYFIVAALLIYQSRKRPTSQSHAAVQETSAEIPSQAHLSFTLFSLIIGTASTLAHASQLRSFGIFDHASQLILFSYLIVINLSPILNLNSRTRLIMTAVLSLIAIVPQFFIHGLGVTVTIAYISVGFLSELVELRHATRMRRARPRVSNLVISLGLLLAGGACFALDLQPSYCEPHDPWWQLHTVWHILSAAGLYYIAQYFDEKLRARNQFKLESRA